MKRLFKSLAGAVMAGVLVLGVSSVASAQTHYSSNISLGVKAGADISKVFFTPSAKQTFQPGALAGLTFRYIEENHFGLIAELNFIQRGWKEDFEGEPFSYSRTLNYFELPVLAHIYFGRRGRFFFNAGPLVALRLSDSVNSSFDTADAAQLPGFPKYHNTLQYSEPIKQRLDYGICAGLGGEFNVTPKHSAYAEVRFYYGLGNLYGSSKRDNFSASNGMSLEFVLGYWLRIK